MRTLPKGHLKVESESVGLPKTNLYALRENRFFLKVIEAELEFVKGPDGRIEEVVLDDEGERYELKKIE